MTDPDIELVVLVDNELDGDAKARLRARLVQDEAIQPQPERECEGSSKAMSACPPASGVCSLPPGQT
jgi:hypothetical protein